jgi:unsaturated rhamnogalacturonyl hydrolase
VERDPGSENVALAGSIAARFMRDHQPASLLWGWEDGVLMASLVDLHRVNADPALPEFYGGWIDYWIGVGYRHLINSSDRCPPAVTALALYQESCGSGYRGVVTDTLSYLYDAALRTADGGINHLGTSDLFGVSLWLDSLFMFGTVLTRWGAHSGESRPLDEFHDQFLIFASHLQDTGGLMMHAHDWPLASQDEGIFWARGNAWVTAATYEYLNVRKSRGETDPEVEAAIRRQVDALLPLQDDDSGLWWTVLNRPGDTYTETSAAALFALGLARGYRGGFLDDSVLPAIEAAVAGIRARVVDDGIGPVVTGISGPTMVGDYDYYASVEQQDDLPYGVGAVILALVESSGL